MSFSATWMDIEIIAIRNEGSQRKTNATWYHFYVDLTKWHECAIHKTEIDSQTENKLMIMKGEGGRNKLGV